MDTQEELCLSGEEGRVGSPFLVENKRAGGDIKDASRDRKKSTKRPRKPHGKVLKSEEERIKALLADEWAENVMPTSVQCRACDKVISLDKRSRYYPGLWKKHRGKCPRINLLGPDRVNRRSVGRISRMDEGY
jgi:hypothetical protein